MNTTAIAVISLIVIIILIKLYSMFNTINKKGIKSFFQGFLKQKLIMLSIVAVVLGIYMFFNPDFQFENPKDLVIDYVSVLINKGE